MKRKIVSVLCFLICSLLTAIPVDGLFGTEFHSDFFSTNSVMSENGFYVENHHDPNKFSGLEGFDYRSKEKKFFHKCKINYVNLLFKDNSLIGCNVFMFMETFEEFEIFLNDIFDTYPNIYLQNSDVDEDKAQQTYFDLNGNALSIRMEKSEIGFQILFSVATHPKDM